MNNMANDKKELTLYDSLHESLVAEKNALPVDLNIDRFTNNAIALLNGNKDLIDFARQNGTSQIKAALMKGAYLGLDFMNKEAHLVKFGNSLNFMVDYRGAKKLVKKYSIRPVKDIIANVVKEGDLFEVKTIDNQISINYQPKPFNDGNVVGAFAYVLFEDGGVQYDTMSLKDLENTRKHSKAPNSPAWRDFTTEMYKKTVLHRLCKHIEIDFDNIQQLDAFNDMPMADAKEQHENNVVEANTVEYEMPDADVVEVEFEQKAFKFDEE